MSGGRRRAGFTLVEILVSILIFSIVSVAMVTILLTSTNIFRAGQYGRASTDEAVTAIATLDDDLKRMVPPRDGGYLYSLLFHADAASPGRDNGNCALAFTIATPTGATQSGAGGRRLVVWWVETINPGTPDEDEVLHRVEAPVAADSSLPAPRLETHVVQQYLVDPPRTLPAGWPAPTIVARRCLHFGAWVSNEVERRAAADDWTLSLPPAGTPIRPYRVAGVDYDYCTEAVGGMEPNPPPTAVRVTLSLAAGRYAPRGFVISDDGATMRVAGVSSLPLMPGAMVRVEDEWIGYADFAGGTLSGVTRSGLRTGTATHPRNAPVRVGQMFALARVFPH